MKNVIFIGDWKTYLEAFLLGYILGGWDSCLFLANATACLSRISLGCGGSSQLLLICNPWCSNIYLKNKTALGTPPVELSQVQIGAFLRES